MNVMKPTVTRPNLTNPRELRDEDIKKYIDLFVREEVENGRDANALSLKDTIEVYLRFNFIPFSAHFLPEKLNSEK